MEGFVPKSAKDFEELGRLVAAKHLLPHAKGAAHYKGAIKALLKAALAPLSAQEVKDVETSVAGELRVQTSAPGRPTRIKPACPTRVGKPRAGCGGD